MTKYKDGRMYYWAYGSNLCEEQMRRRCPRARKVGPLRVNDGAVVFRRVADVEPREGSVAHGGLWLITPECERALDGYEGIHTSMRYEKRYLVLSVRGEPRDCLFYVMVRDTRQEPPTDEYYATVRRGYEDFGLPLEALERALEESGGRPPPRRRKEHQERPRKRKREGSRCWVGHRATRRDGGQSCRT